MQTAALCIMAIENDDDRAFMQRLYTVHERLMYRAALKMTRNIRDADDVVGAACESLIKGIDHLKAINVRAHPAYITSAVRNQALMLLRRRRIEYRAIGHLLGSNRLPKEYVTDDVDTRLFYQCTLEKVVETIQRLSENDQHILRMKFFDQLSDQEIGEILGLQLSSVRSRLTRARRRLREALKEDKDEQ